MVLQFRANRTRKKMEEQFPVALDVFVRGLRAGHPIAAALELLTVEMPDPIGSQFGMVVDEVTYGAELRDALQAWPNGGISTTCGCSSCRCRCRARPAATSPKSSRICRRVIRERQSMMMKVRALSSEGRMTAVMLTVLPIFAFTACSSSIRDSTSMSRTIPFFVPGFVGAHRAVSRRIYHDPPNGRLEG